MNRVIVVGNISGDIYYDQLTINRQPRWYLRLLLYSDHPVLLRGLRIVLWDDLARLYFPYLQKGSEIAVIGSVVLRRHRGRVILEVETENMLLLRNIDWDHGEAMREQLGLKKPKGESNRMFLVGEVKNKVFRWVPHRNNGKEYALLQLWLNDGARLTRFPAVVRGRLAELANPYLREGSRIAVDGHLQTPPGENGYHELTVHHMTFLDSIDWENGILSTQRLLEQLHGGAHGD